MNKVFQQEPLEKSFFRRIRGIGRHHSNVSEVSLTSSVGRRCLRMQNKLGVHHDTVIDPKDEWKTYLDIYETFSDSEWDQEIDPPELRPPCYEACETLEDAPCVLPPTEVGFFKKVFRKRRSGSVIPQHFEPEPLGMVAFQEKAVAQENTSIATDTASTPAVADFRSLARATVFLRPLDGLIDVWPQIEGIVLIAEVAILMFALYELSLLIETIALTLRALCLPLIIVGRMLGYM